MPPKTSSSATLVSSGSSKLKPKIRTNVSERTSTGSVETTTTATDTASVGWETSPWPSTIPKSRKERTKDKERGLEMDREKEEGKGKGKDISPHSAVATLIDEAGLKGQECYSAAEGSGDQNGTESSNSLREPDAEDSEDGSGAESSDAE
ncbi:hypothetical protein V5O48_015778 [Marasmius crinis-equi]|uniref:Uncharacterized protein n=1 Tax=Marasmius crinis-equi TaxID=585013 RepID=A0ABR3ETL5_9AGAR